MVKMKINIILGLFYMIIGFGIMLSLNGLPDYLGNKTSVVIALIGLFMLIQSIRYITKGMFD